VSPVTEIPTHRDAPKAINTTVLLALADSIATGEEAAGPTLRTLADQVIRSRIKGWEQEATVELQAVCDAAITKATRDWQKRKRDLERQVARIVASTHTQGEMDEWAAAAIAQVEAEVDERGLISTDVLEAIKFTRPARKGETKSAPTNGVECLDEEFMTWFVGQLGERGISTNNRLMLRLLLVAALDWIRDTDGHWREPRLSEV
jgi:hypothetical protein